MSTLIKLSDNRTLAFETYGDSEGYPMLYCHGFPGSRVEAAHFHETALKNQCRIIAIDRSGMGLSEFDENRTILSFAHDIDELTDQLNLKQFSMISHSGGAPFLLACAYLMPHKIKKAAIVSGISAPELWSKRNGISQKERILSVLLKRASFLTTPMMYITRMLLNNPDKMMKHMVKTLPDVDVALFKTEKMQNIIIKSTQEVFKQGLKGASLDMKLLFKPWGFKLQDIHIPITIWHGASDTQAPVAHARIHEHLLPDANLKLIANEAHTSLIMHCADEILSDLLSSKVVKK
jgi:pimeloyl-ACP methyl ester carboxylesterase